MFTQQQIDEANSWCQGTMAEALGITFALEAGGTLTATMPVDHRTLQPMGLLHGGATAALAETLGSSGSALLIDREKNGVVGIEVNANHLRGVRSGTVKATATLLHQGRTTHVWDIRVKNEKDELVAVCRLTNVIIAKRA